MQAETNQVLITCDAESEGLLTEELRRLGVARLPGTWLDTGDAIQGSILLVETNLDFESFSVALQPSIFARHLAPVDYEVALEGTPTDIDSICTLAPVLSERIDPTASFSVQARILGEGKLPFRKVVLNETLSQAIETEVGATMDCRKPSQVVSILCSPTKAYVGLSRTALNRSAWPGGKHRFKREDDQVSRSEFKLLEAFEVFGIDVPSKGLALDIGASPGGWSRVLASRGLKVDAVDPGYLDARLKGNRSIVHIRKRIQEYSPGAKEFAAIVNDMKMDARDSIGIMNEFAPKLRQDGIAVITLKMPKGTQPRIALDMIHDDVAQLATAYQIVGARQLYHNRSEITVVMKSLPRDF